MVPTLAYYNLPLSSKGLDQPGSLCDVQRQLDPCPFQTQPLKQHKCNVIEHRCDQEENEDPGLGSVSMMKEIDNSSENKKLYN